MNVIVDKGTRISLETVVKRPVLAVETGHELIVAHYFFLFFISGFSALLYQIIWQRILTLSTGTDAYSVALIVGAFMGGLGFGSFFGGHLADRLDTRRRIFAFSISQFGIGLFALISTSLFHSFLYEQLSHLAKSPVAMAFVLLLGLLLPTTLMGMSLPLLAKTLTKSVEEAPTTIGYLYGFNTLGAAVGAFVTTWVLVRHFGFVGAINIGAVLNLISAIGALLTLPYLKTKGLLKVENPDPGRVASPTETYQSQKMRFFQTRNGKLIALPISVWILLSAFSGFIALSLEIVWFRLLGVMLKSTTFTFGHLLSVFLASVSIGVFCGIRYVNKIRKPIRVFFALQALIAIYTGVFLALFLAVLPNHSYTLPFWEYFGGDNPIDLRVSFAAINHYLTAHPASAKSAHDFILLYFLLPVILIGPPTLLMGLSYPVLQKIIQNDLLFLGRRTGWFQTSNILGSMLGAFLTGCIFLSLLGSVLTLKALLCCGSIFLFLYLYDRWGRSHLFKTVLTAVTLTALLIWTIPSSSALWAELHGTTPDLTIVYEDASGLALLKNEKADFSNGTKVFANGLGQSTIPFYDFHITLGIVPAMLHPNPKDVAIIGMGAGATLFAAGGRKETQTLTCIEIVKPLLETVKQYQLRRKYGGTQSLLEDSRIQYLFGDGRAVILTGGKKYDIIEADALRITSAYANNLFSYEYFQLLKERLKPRGLAISAAPTSRIINGFIKVFPYAVLITTTDTLIIGSNEPIEWNSDAIISRLTNSTTKSYYSRAGINVNDYVAVFVDKHKTFTPDDDRSRALDFNTDLFPKDEYLIPLGTR